MTPAENGPFEIKAWAALVEAMRGEIASAPSLEEASRIAAARIHAAVAPSAPLVRVYAVLPHEVLPPDVQAFVEMLAPDGAVVSRRTPVLALLGTAGAKPEWNDRRASWAHKGIPLVSAAFVDTIPMLARLLRELGMDLAWLDEAPDIITRRLIGGFNGVFYVEDARTVEDARGRLVIPATDFVEGENIRTVFGMGGIYPDGTVLVCIVFTRVTVSRDTVDRLTSLLTMLKGETFGAVRARRFFG